MLGLGQDATGQGDAVGLQLSLFDVSNLRRPRRLSKRHTARGWSDAEYDHHAFLYWRPARLVVVPVYAIDEVGQISHPNSYGISPALVIGDALYTVSDVGIEKRALQTFSRRAWVGFPRG